MLCLLSLLLGLTGLQTDDSKYKIPLLTCWECQGSPENRGQEEQTFQHACNVNLVSHNRKLA